jgi:hypothetical protein
MDRWSQPRTYRDIMIELGLVKSRWQMNLLYTLLVRFVLKHAQLIKGAIANSVNVHTLNLLTRITGPSEPVSESDSIVGRRNFKGQPAKGWHYY